MQCSLTHRSFTVQSSDKCRRKFIQTILNNLFTRCEVSVTARRGNLQHLFEHALSDTYVKHYIRKCKTASLAIRLRSVFK